jgi:hypothetical protein
MAPKNYACIKAGRIENVVVLDDDVPSDPSFLTYMAATWDSVVPVETLSGYVAPGAAKVGTRWVGITDSTHPNYVAPVVLDLIADVTKAMQAQGLTAAQIAKAVPAIRQVFGG